MRTYEHWLLVHDPHPQSLAALVLLTRKYLVITRPVRKYRVWLSYRKKLLKKLLKERGELVCHYCGKGKLRVNTLDVDKVATLDHVMPKSKGGAEYSSSNLVVACNRCNQKKRDKLPENVTMGYDSGRAVSDQSRC